MAEHRDPREFPVLWRQQRYGGGGIPPEPFDIIGPSRDPDHPHRLHVRNLATGEEYVDAEPGELVWYAAMPLQLLERVREHAIQPLNATVTDIDAYQTSSPGSASTYSSPV